MRVDGFSLDGQKNSLKRFADREEMEIVDIYEDAGKSGKSIDGRPAFKQMLCDIENGLQIDYILVYKLSRFGRNAADILNSLEHVQSFGVNLICIEEGISSSQTSGKLLIPLQPQFPLNPNSFPPSHIVFLNTKKIGITNVFVSNCKSR